MLFSQKLAFLFQKEIVPNGCLLYELEQREQHSKKKKKDQLSNSPRVPPAGTLSAPTFPPETTQVLESPEINGVGEKERRKRAGDMKKVGAEE